MNITTIILVIAAVSICLVFLYIIIRGIIANRIDVIISTAGIMSQVDYDEIIKIYAYDIWESKNKSGITPNDPRQNWMDAEEFIKKAFNVRKVYNNPEYSPGKEYIITYKSLEVT